MWSFYTAIIIYHGIYVIVYHGKNNSFFLPRDGSGTDNFAHLSVVVIRLIVYWAKYFIFFPFYNKNLR